MEMTYQIERFADVAGEQERLTNAHWAETEQEMYGPVPSAVDEQGFAILEQAGVLHIQTVRRDGMLAGYAAFVITAQPQLGGMTTASLIGLFLDSDTRNASPWIAITLLRRAEESLEGRGVAGVMYSSPHSRPCDALYRRLGAKPVETNYFKSLRG